MDISVVICTYNRAASLCRTLTSLIQQDAGPDLVWEIVVVDNNSNDSTAATVAEFASSTPVPTTYVWEKQQGLSFARNAGIDKSRGRILAFTDDDVTPASDWLRRIVASMKQYNADGVGGKILPKWPCTPPAWLTADKSDVLLQRLALLDSDTVCVAKPNIPVKIFGANMAYKRDMFQQIGNFDITLGRVAARLYSHEEKNLIERALSLHKVIVYDPQVLVWHHIAAERLRKRYFRRLSMADGEKRAARNEPSGKWHFCGVPIRMFPHALRDFWRWTWSVLRLSARSFRRETKLWFYFGFVKFRMQDYFGRKRTASRSAFFGSNIKFRRK